MHCPRCGTEVSDSALFCRSCGTELPKRGGEAPVPPAASLSAHPQHRAPHALPEFAAIALCAAFVVLASLIGPWYAFDGTIAGLVSFAGISSSLNLVQEFMLMEQAASLGLSAELW